MKKKKLCVSELILLLKLLFKMNGFQMTFSSAPTSGK